MLRLENRSRYATEDLRRFLLRGMRACRIRHLDVIVVPSPIRSRGCADVGGRRMVIAIAAPSRLTMRRLARLFEHEAAHIRGMEHEGMPRDLLYSLGDVPRWARNLKIRYRGSAERDPSYRVYAVRLRPSRPGGPEEIYVGHTALEPERRLKKHRSGSRGGSGVVRRRGKRLAPELVRGEKPARTRNEAFRAERRTAARLRRRGLRVVSSDPR